MVKNITIASACMRYFRQSCLSKDTIAVRPPRGWMNRNLPTEARREQWLKSMDVTWMPTQVGQAEDWVDARMNRTVYLFLNCFEHGCKSCCFTHWQKNEQHPAVTNREARQALRYKLERLVSLGYTVRVMWECVWRDEEEAAMEPTPYFNPRDAFYGGRTEVVRHYATADEDRGEEIRYVDVCSLYPWVNWTCEYPVGHPEEVLDAVSLDSLFCVADVTVRAPRGFALPVLPDRVGGKLIFHLCRRCAQEQVGKAFLERSATCDHSEEERAFRGTWCTPELEKAVRCGYEVLEIHRAWHFPRRSTDLFKGYVDKWLKNKTEASGWPDDCRTEEARLAYVEEYICRYSLPLEYEKVECNPGLKTVSKRSLNSFWGKFGENAGKISVEVLDSTWMVCERFNDPCLCVESVLILNEDRVEIRYKCEEDDDLGGIVHNEFVVAFTTCHACLKLYDYLERLNPDHVLYGHRHGQHRISLAAGGSVHRDRSVPRRDDERIETGGLHCGIWVYGAQKLLVFNQRWRRDV